ncbi:CGH_3_collapsed_G0002890.mRNA.1.CDS.1 [Saccharomyces cerevisiae]|nr:CGH_3_collapsed_G0002890.mRNA.1.CDS.1 [Saccharomyces cerevisiae]
MSEEFPTPQLLDELEDQQKVTTPYEKRELSSNRVLKDIFAGTIGGIAQVLVGQPFDTTKVRLQTATTRTTTLEVLRNLVKNEGVFAFYKGALTPLLGVGICVSVQFGVNEAMKRFFQNYNASKNPNMSSQDVDLSRSNTLPLSQYYVCGLTGGVVNSFLASPIEQIRIRLQTQTSNGGDREFKGPWDCIKKLKAQGGLMRGLFPTMIRAGHGLGTYFLVYEALVAREIGTGLTRNEIPPWKLCLFGAFSGTMLWLTVYPLDVVKSIIQNDDLRKPKYKNSISYVAKTIYAKEGIRAFFKGFGPTMVRSAPVNGATFLTFELVMRFLGEE